MKQGACHLPTASSWASQAPPEWRAPWAHTKRLFSHLVVIRQLSWVRRLRRPAPNHMTVFDAFLYVKKTIISQFFLGSRPLWLLSKLLQVQPPVSRADFASVEAYIKHLELQIEYGHIVGKKRDLGFLDPMIFSGKIRKNRKS